MNALGKLIADERFDVREIGRECNHGLIEFPKSFSIFAFTAASILMSGGHGRLKPSPGIFFVASMPSLLPLAAFIFSLAAVSRIAWRRARREGPEWLVCPWRGSPQSCWRESVRGKAP